MPTEMLIREERRASQAPPDERRIAARTQLERVRRLKLNAGAWVLGTVVLTTLWVLNQWNVNGAFESFGHEGDAGQWNPTLWALAEVLRTSQSQVTMQSFSTSCRMAGSAGLSPSLDAVLAAESCSITRP